MRLSISTKLPDSGKSDHRVSPVTWNSTIQAFAAARSSDEAAWRSASVAQVYRSMQRRAPLSTLPGDSSRFVRHRHAVERLSRENAGERLRLVPAQAAAKNAAAAPQPLPAQDRRPSRKPRPRGNAQHAAVSIQCARRSWRVAGNVADVGENQHRQVWIEKMA